MTETNRKENKKIDKNKVFSMIIIIALLAIGGHMVFFYHLKSEIISYEQDEDFLPLPEGFFTYQTYLMYDMSDAEAKDLRESPQNYRSYCINIDIKNISWQKVHWVEADLSKRYKDIWMYRPGLAEWEIDIEPNKTYSGHICIIVKTADMTEKEIDELIRGIGITVSAQNVEWPSFVTSETIFFDNN